MYTIRINDAVAPNRRIPGNLAAAEIKAAVFHPLAPGRSKTIWFKILQPGNRAQIIGNLLATSGSGCAVPAKCQNTGFPSASKFPRAQAC